MAKKLDLPPSGVNLRYAACALLLLAACGPSPMPVAIGNAPAHEALLGGPRRALYEHERIPANAPAIEWRINAGSGMRGTLLLLDSTIVTATTNRQLLAYHLRTGRRHWDQRFGNAVTSTVLYQDRTVYVGTDERDGGLHAMDITRGRKQWHREVGAVNYTPVLDNNIIYLGTEAGSVMALSTNRGNRIWSVRLPGAIAETLVDAGSHVVAITNHDSVFGLRKSDGAVVARGRVPGTPLAAPALTGNTVVVAVQPGIVVGLDAGTLAERWRVATNAPVLAAPVVSQDGAVYVVARDGGVHRIRDGQTTVLAQLGHSVAGSLTLVQDHLLVGSYDGTLLAVTLDGRVAWKVRVDDSIVTPVSVRDGAIFVPLLRGAIVKLR